MNRVLLRAIIVVALLAGAAGLFSFFKGRQDAEFNRSPPHGIHQRPAFERQTRAPGKASNVELDVTTVAGDFEFPWGMAFLPDGRMLVTERAGRLRIVSPDG